MRAQAWLLQACNTRNLVRKNIKYEDKRKYLQYLYANTSQICLLGGLVKRIFFFFFFLQLYTFCYNIPKFSYTQPRTPIHLKLISNIFKLQTFYQLNKAFGLNQFQLY